LKFAKYQSVGNDFVIVAASDLGATDPTNLAKAMCDRKFGIGADGLLIVDPSAAPPTMRMFNPDGTEDFCGNGLRCAALYLSDRKLASGDSMLQHRGQLVGTEFDAQGWIDITLAESSFDPTKVPLSADAGEVFDRELRAGEWTFRASSVTTGSTHTILFLRSPVEEAVFSAASPCIEHHEWFPERTSVIWVWPSGADASGGRPSFDVRIWERGVGETLGCGTGVAAVAACWFRLHPNQRVIVVRSRGGETIVARGTNTSLIVSAKAKRVYEGTWKLNSDS
jgi:diaminopimelate epimerase